jgi:hypothetical protein
MRGVRMATMVLCPPSCGQFFCNTASGDLTNIKISELQVRWLRLS